MGYGKERPCKRCGETKLIQARGLCQSCFTAVGKAGELDQYPARHMVRCSRTELEALKTTVRTFLHDLDAHEAQVQPSQILMNHAMWMQVAVFRKLVG